MGCPRLDVGSATPAPSALDGQNDHLVADRKKILDLRPVVLERLNNGFHVCGEALRPPIALVDAHPGGLWVGMQLELFLDAQRSELRWIDVPRRLLAQEPLVVAPYELHVLLRHRPRSISRGASRVHDQPGPNWEPARYLAGLAFTRRPRLPRPRSPRLQERPRRTLGLSAGLGLRGGPPSHRLLLRRFESRSTPASQPLGLGHLRRGQGSRPRDETLLPQPGGFEGLLAIQVRGGVDDHPLPEPQSDDTRSSRPGD